MEKKKNNSNNDWPFYKETSDFFTLKIIAMYDKGSGWRKSRFFI